VTARILVVDDIPANVKLLEARLQAEYFQVVTALNGPDALAICAEGGIDLILLDIMMPGMDGFEVCAKLKANPSTVHIPVVIVTALDQPADRIRGLEAGADDFLTKPVKDIQLMSRVKSLVRSIDIDELLSERAVVSHDRARLLLIDERTSSVERMHKTLRNECDLEVATDPQLGFFQAVEKDFDCVLLATGFANFDPLRICSQLRSLDRTRFLPILLVAEQGEDERISRALELGVNDYVVRPVDAQELIARIRTQVRRKRFNDALRQSVVQTIEMAVTDGLTGLHNRRYLETHLDIMFERSVSRGRPLSYLIADIDKFKSINDGFGHDGGDDVLREFANLLRRQVRGADLVSRYGGEEFVVAMPDTDAELAARVAERVRAAVAEKAFELPNGRKIPVTVSVGVATLHGRSDSVASLAKRADTALYEAKAAGRNRVVQKAA
jgi:two-component system, cell cycle response regulator